MNFRDSKTKHKAYLASLLNYIFALPQHVYHLIRKNKENLLGIVIVICTMYLVIY